jgi:hypothetical protein
VPAIVKPSREGPALESDLMRDVRKWLAEQPDIRIHRNAAGFFKVIDENGTIRKMRTGLAIGASDLIGSLTARVAPVIAIHDGGRVDYVLSKDIRSVARFLAIELKQVGKKPTDDQERFLADKRAAGGVAFWADNIQTVKDMIEKARRWEI